MKNVINREVEFKTLKAVMRGESLAGEMTIWG